MAASIVKKIIIIAKISASIVSQASHVKGTKMVLQGITEELAVGVAGIAQLYTNTLL